MQSLIEMVEGLVPMSRATDNYKLAYKKALNDVIALIKQHESAEHEQVGVEDIAGIIAETIKMADGLDYSAYCRCRDYTAVKIIDAIRPYLKQQQPVSVDVVERVARTLEPKAFTEIIDPIKNEYSRLKANTNEIIREQALKKAK